jgi:hypothetical protein
LGDAASEELTLAIMSHAKPLSMEASKSLPSAIAVEPGEGALDDPGG